MIDLQHPLPPLRVFPALGEPLLCICSRTVPPLVPTLEALWEWDEWWWYDGDVVRVFTCGRAGLFASYARDVKEGCANEHPVNGMDGEWAGPVLERPVKS